MSSDDLQIISNPDDLDSMFFFEGEQLLDAPKKRQSRFSKSAKLNIEREILNQEIDRGNVGGMRIQHNYDDIEREEEYHNNIESLNRQVNNQSSVIDKLLKDRVYTDLIVEDIIKGRPIKKAKQERPILRPKIERNTRRANDVVYKKEYKEKYPKKKPFTGRQDGEKSLLERYNYYKNEYNKCKIEISKLNEIISELLVIVDKY